MDTNQTYKLINFNIPLHLSNNMDGLLKYKGISRTSVLNRLIEGWCRSETVELQKDKTLNDVVLSIQKQNVESERKRVVRHQKEQPDTWFGSSSRWEESF